MTDFEKEPPGIPKRVTHPTLIFLEDLPKRPNSAIEQRGRELGRLPEAQPLRRSWQGYLGSTHPLVGWLEHPGAMKNLLGQWLNNGLNFLGLHI